MIDADWRFCGNRQSLDKLRRAVEDQAPRHAYLISGPRSVGKRTVAKRFAQSLLCNHAVAGNPCFACSDCERVERDTHPDVSTFSLATQGQIEPRGGAGSTLTIATARSISAHAHLRPMIGAWRCIIVDDAESLMPDAQEALLKTLEEPPPFLVLVLVTSSLDAILPTVRSRCEPIELRPVGTDDIELFLRAHTVDGTVTRLAAEMSGGLPGVAIELAANPDSIEATDRLVDDVANWIASSDFDRIAIGLSLGESMAKDRTDVMTRIKVVATIWRDALLVRTGNSDRIVYRARADFARRIAGSCATDDILAALMATWTCCDDLERNVRPRLALETMVISWPRIQNRS